MRVPQRAAPACTAGFRCRLSDLAGRRTMRRKARKRRVCAGLAISLAALVVGLVPVETNAEAETGDLIGRLQFYETQAADTLPEIGRRFGLGFVELMAANPGIDPWVPARGTRLLLPSAHLLPDAEREGVVINLAEQRLYYFPPDGGQVVTFPVGVGRAGCETPTGKTTIVGKRRDPSWTPPESIRTARPELPPVIPPGPQNPLGTHALDLGWPGYVIHGTNKPLGIGRRVSHGCVRLYPENIVLLFEIVPVGAPVNVVDQPVKLGWSGGELFLEVHPTQRQSDEVEETGEVVIPEPTPQSLWRILRAAGDNADRLDWPLVRRVTMERRGVPVRITR